MPIYSSTAGAYYYKGGMVSKPEVPINVAVSPTSSTSLDVNFSPPQWNGGSEITSYTCTMTPGNVTQTLTQSTGGAFSYTGLSKLTSYTFTVYATNSIGDSSTVTISGSTPEPTGEAVFTSIGTTTWTVPAGVTSITILTIGGGGYGNSSNPSKGGGGGALAYRNTYTVTPGQILNVIVGNKGTSATTNGGMSYVSLNPANTVLCRAGGGFSGASATTPGVGGTVTAGTGFPGGTSGNGSTTGTFGGGGGGAGGYTGKGGQGGSSGLTYGSAGNAGVGGAGGGGAGAGGGPGTIGGGASGGFGGGVGIYGQGSNGAGGTWNIAVGPWGGNGADGSGGSYGAGGGGAAGGSKVGQGVVRIIWPGTARIFPSTRTAYETPFT